MPNVYTEEYLREWEIIEEQYGEKNGGRPAALRRARELRKQGFTVEFKKWDFTDLSRSIAWSVHAKRKKGGA